MRALRHITGEVDFNETFLDAARVPDFNRVGEVGDGWKVANATLSGERQMVSGSGSGGVDRIGGSGAEHLVEMAKANAAAGLDGGWDDPVVRQQIMTLLSEERIRGWTNQRVRAGLKAGRSPGPGELDRQGPPGLAEPAHPGPGHRPARRPGPGVGRARPHRRRPTAAEAYALDLPREVKGMLRSRANTIEGGTSEVNKNIVGERVLGLPREPDPYQGAAWRDVPRS